MEIKLTKHQWVKCYLQYTVHFCLLEGTQKPENEPIYKTHRTGINFAVLQSVADFQPDVDAIYRLTRITPFSFPRPKPFVPAPIVQKGNPSPNITPNIL